MTKRLVYTCLVVALCAVPSQAAFTVITNPDATYLTSTTKLDFAGLADGTNFSSVTAGSVTLTSSVVLNKRSVPGSWATWSSPPNSESATPAVAFTQGATTDTLTLSTGVGTFGFEIEPDDFGAHLVTASFFSGATLLGTITQTVTGASGARLAAASDTAIDRVVVTVAGTDFGMAQFRYALSAVPEPTSIGLLLTGLVLVSRRLRRRSA